MILKDEKKIIKLDEKKAVNLDKKMGELWEEQHLEVTKMPSFMNDHLEAPCLPIEPDFLEKYFEKFNAMLTPKDKGLTELHSHFENIGQEINLQYKTDLSNIEMNLNQKKRSLKKR